MLTVWQFKWTNIVQSVIRRVCAHHSRSCRARSCCCRSWKAPCSGVWGVLRAPGTRCGPTAPVNKRTRWREMMGMVIEGSRAKNLGQIRAKVVIHEKLMMLPHTSKSFILLPSRIGLMSFLFLLFIAQQPMFSTANIYRINIIVWHSSSEYRQEAAFIRSGIFWKSNPNVIHTHLFTVTPSLILLLLVVFTPAFYKPRAVNMKSCGLTDNWSCIISATRTHGGKCNSGGWQRVMLHFPAPSCVHLSSLVPQRALQETMGYIKAAIDIISTEWLKRFSLFILHLFCINITGRLTPDESRSWLFLWREQLQFSQTYICSTKKKEDFTLIL